MTYYLLKPCRTATAFISTPKRPTRVDLGAAAERLRLGGWTVSDAACENSSAASHVNRGRTARTGANIGAGAAVRCRISDRAGAGVRWNPDWPSENPNTGE